MPARPQHQPTSGGPALQRPASATGAAAPGRARDEPVDCGLQPTTPAGWARTRRHKERMEERQPSPKDEASEIDDTAFCTCFPLIFVLFCSGQFTFPAASHIFSYFPTAKKLKSKYSYKTKTQSSSRRRLEWLGPHSHLQLHPAFERPSGCQGKAEGASTVPALRCCRGFNHLVARDARRRCGRRGQGRGTGAACCCWCWAFLPPRAH